MFNFVPKAPVRRLFGGLLIVMAASSARAEVGTGNVIFIHPDGAGSSMYAAMRMLTVGPDGMTAWDRLERAGVYRGHQRHALGTSSNAGATAHAFGVKAEIDDYGIDPDRPFKALSGKDMSIMTEAMRAGIAVGVINSGHLAEPGTGVFLANAKSRRMYTDIAADIVASGAELIFGGGERFLIPAGAQGHWTEAGERRDGRNLIDEAAAAGYTVVYTREELLALDPGVDKVLGVFAENHTFNDLPEEALLANELPEFDPRAPSLDEMTDYALRFFEARGEQFLLVIEEESTDNFANDNNARGALLGLTRADEAIARAIDFVARRPETLIVTAADSDAGGMEVQWVERADYGKALPSETANGAPVDGATGTGGAPFVARADRFGEVLQFYVSWAAFGDGYGGVVAKAHGLNSELLPVNTDNTDIYRMMYATLFGEWLD